MFINFSLGWVGFSKHDLTHIHISIEIHIISKSCGGCVGDGGGGQRRSEKRRQKEKLVCIQQEVQTLTLKGEAEVHSPLYLPSKATHWTELWGSE